MGKVPPCFKGITSLTGVGNGDEVISQLLLEKLIVAQLVKKLPVFYGPRRSITVFTRAHHWSLPWTRCIHSTHSHTMYVRPILILSFHLCLDLPSYVFRP